jgi:hypothetical protein
LKGIFGRLHRDPNAISTPVIRSEPAALADAILCGVRGVVALVSVPKPKVTSTPVQLPISTPRPIVIPIPHILAANANAQAPTFGPPRPPAPIPSRLPAIPPPLRPSAQR